MKDNHQWLYLGHPCEVHEDKIVFKSPYLIESPIMIQVGNHNFSFDEDIVYEGEAANGEKVYHVTFSNYYQCLSFLFQWSRQLTEKEFDDVIQSKKFTQYFNVEDLSKLLTNLDYSSIDEVSWKKFGEFLTTRWSISGIELVDTNYDLRIFSFKKQSSGSADYNLNIDKSGRYKFKVWGEESRKVINEIEMISYFIGHLLSPTMSLNQKHEMHINKSKIISDSSRKFTLVGGSDITRQLRAKIEFHKNNNRHLWINGKFGVGKTLYAKVIAEEYCSHDSQWKYLSCSPYNQKNILDELEEFCSRSESQLLIIDKLDLCDESSEVSLWKIVKRHKDKKFIFISSKKSSLYFEGEEITIPPLKDRIEDIVQLTEFFVKSICLEMNIPQKEISEVFFKKFKVYQWPGNISELRYFLKNLIQYHYFDQQIDYRNEDYRQQCDPQHRQLFRFQELKEKYDYPPAFWKEKILKSS